MLIEHEWKRIYFNHKLRKIIPFYKKFNSREKKETAVILKEFLNRDRRYNPISMLSLLNSERIPEQYQASCHYPIPVNPINEFSNRMFPDVQETAIINCCLLIILKWIIW
ncbi:hypothetical protein HNP36_003409 [Chryseobacterium shigense]|uniref:Uncharacterized protein n=1 Tax=Chryseobacterium shigense TaxID=297244 RepID=A0A841N6Y6_9FLAO|nr:hypothetical protein [Chryseobacterium shigense]